LYGLVDGAKVGKLSLLEHATYVGTWYTEEKRRVISCECNWRVVVNGTTVSVLHTRAGVT